VSKPAAQASSYAQRTLNKSVFALAIEPLNLALTVTGRKAYDVMLLMALDRRPAPDGSYSSPISEILRGTGSHITLASRVQTYIQQMVQTSVVYRPLAESDRQASIEGVDRLEASSDEARTFSLLAEARIYMKGGQHWVSWFYPPTIRDELLNPARWAQISLSSIARLSTYTGLALYEIAARYRDAPGGLTTKHPPDFWTRVLREGGGAGARVWRKFKSERLVPAIREINEATDIHVELVETREGREVSHVQFRVKRKPRTNVEAAPIDVTLPMQAARLGIREDDLDELIRRFGSDRVQRGFTAIDEYLEKRGTSAIMNRLSYLKAVLERQSVDDAGGGIAQSSSVKAVDTGMEREELRNRWLASRLAELQRDFATLSEAEQAEWIDRAGEGLTNASQLKRIRAREWMSPIIKVTVLRCFADAKHGAGWDTPSDVDLVMHGAETTKRANRG
jgi:hypothetical protein